MSNLQFKEVSYVLERLKESQLYHTLANGKYTTYSTDEVDSVFALIHDAIIYDVTGARSGTECVWGISEDLEDDFNNRREVYCLVAGIAHLCNVIHQKQTTYFRSSI